uniref:Uncharacterized protein n=1 Tax=Rhizophora mucronata TaxID=61149 RepID=A0A2P2PUM1_RHIMU
MRVYLYGKVLGTYAKLNSFYSLYIFVLLFVLCQDLGKIIALLSGNSVILR